MSPRSVIAGAFVILTCYVTSMAQEKAPDDAVYDYKTWECQIKGNKLTLKVAGNVTINSPRGEEYGDFALVEDSYCKLKKVEISVFDANGDKLFTLGKKDLAKSCGFGGGLLYADVCHYTASLMAPRFPYTVKYEYVLESKSLFFWPEAQLQHMIPVKKATYTLTVPEDFEFKWKARNADLEPWSTREGGKVVYLWSREDIPAMEDVDFVPAEDYQPATIIFAAEQFDLDGYVLQECSWKGIGKWHQQLTRDKYLTTASPPNPGPNRTAAELIKEVYDDVRRNIRYVAIEAGIGGWQPYEAALTAERGYGDCKDMSTLLISKIRNLGLPAYPVLVLTRDHGRIDLDFPDVYFNHVIAVSVLDSDTIWMDPTCDNCPFGELPRTDEDIDVLVNTESGGVIRRTPASTSDDNLTTRETRVFVDSTRHLSFETTMEATGNYAIYWRGALLGKSDAETRQFIGGQLSGGERSFRIRSVSVQNLQDADKPLVITVAATKFKPEDEIGGTVYCNPFFFNALHKREQVPLEKRLFPLDMVYPDSEVDHIILTRDESLPVNSVVVPAPDSISFSFGRIRLDSRVAGDTAFIDLAKAYSVYAIEVDEFGEYETFRGRLKDIVGQNVKLITAAQH
ncbi:MAG: DUF3857 and transglutaminase domain-containing protein [candidate division Zixibacteria bacterium]|nr:DUF3857 and transglutaminase domain-containing protein [candidate division Zixibacteria bacterium]